MDRYRALRGVCIGPERHLLPTDAPVELDAGTARFLVGIGAVELVADAPAPADPPAPEPAPSPALVQAPAASTADAPAPAAPEPAPAKPAKKEK